MSSSAPIAKSPVKSTSMVHTKRGASKEAPRDDSSSDKKKLKTELDALECLCRVAAWTLDINRALQPVNVINFNSVFTLDVVTCLRKIEAIFSLDSVINLAMADPQMLQLRSKFITMKTSKATTRFFGVGTVAYSTLLSNDKSHQICLHFLDRIFPRLVAVLGSVLQERALYMGSYYNGVSISTFAKTGGPSPTKGVGPSSPSKSRGGCTASVPNILPCDTNIPVYDSTHSFNANTYDTLPLIDNKEIERGTAIAAIFTVGMYGYDKITNRTPHKHLNMVISLNLQAIILLAHATQSHMIDDHPPAKPLAVDSAPEVQLTDSETDVEAVDVEDTSIVSGPKDISELL